MIVLLLGQDPDLSSYRVQVLKAAGFEVISPNSRKEAVYAIENRPFDVAVLSYTLPNEMAQEFADLLHQNCPACPLIAISESAWEDSRIAPDDTVVGHEGPDALLDAVRRASGQRLRRVK